MKKLCIVGIASLATGLLAGDGIRAIADDQKFEAELSGDNEVPPVVTATTGKVEIEFNGDETKAEFELEVRKGVRVRQAHIHCGARGVNGPIVVFLAGNHNPGWDVDGSWIENTTVTDTNVLARTSAECPFAIANLRDVARAAREGVAYVNVHTTVNPGGEVRGQLESAADDRR
jgi:hypothetical protein